ncbi:protein turtle homolog A [Pygocentrus nattereri]|uniref:Immunoglobulin superfamily, member 9a n=1 Tax=Pygocentrus nattereri TaxID=42514 RepID=A0A3B4D292_PYGNA|nr:protein turtle homolog A [Pygocentrus nattereri]XP_037403457.1 protein turtle homolog A [Pygocentrus nattereri]
MAMKRLPLPELIITAVVFVFGVADCVGPTVWGKQGGSALLKCSLAPAEGSSAPLHVVEWVRQGYDIPVLIKFGSYAPRVHPSYEGRVSLSGGTTLKVMGLVLEDEGWYECRILLLDKPSDETRNGSWTLLSVTAPPVFAEAPPPVTEAFVGRPITLKCVARGNPPPSIKWHKDGVLMKQRGSVKIVNGSLSVGSVSRQTAGRYQCQASNSEGNETRTTQLSVKGPPVIITPPKDTVLNMSQNALLQCQAEADPPNMTYVWMREEENVYHIESLKSRVKVMVDGTLLIPSVIPGDSGNYTCMPTNGLPAPPSASAVLTVQHPALVTQMPDQTFLPTGMSGVISCPLAAEPPLLRVDWTKDGKMLDLGAYPGWTLTSEGSIVIATANDDAAGVYTCTPYNSYGTMGQSKPTTVILQDPPSLRLSPREEYRQDVGRTLLIPCQADGDPPPKVTWTKIGSSTRSLYSVAVNGSLLLQPLSKEHCGQWECSVANRVATITSRTTVLVLGTSPHAVSSVSVEVRVNQANISWEPGFDGGFTQTFTIWLKCACSEGDQQEWQSVPGPSSGTSLLVSGLFPSTEYQFSVLAQNKLGSGPFSEITTVRTLNALPMVSGLEPPTLLSFNQSSEGVYLWWAAPSAQQPPIDNFILQSRLKEGVWLNLDEDISVNQSEMLVLGLQKNSNYELRLLSRRGEQLSLPSRSINVSTVGLGPTSSRLLEFVPQPLLAGLMGGMGFLCLALLLALATVCVIGHRRRQRRRKRMEDIPPALHKSPSVKAGLAPGSPDSALKLLPSRPISSSSSSSDHSSYSKFSHSDYPGQRQQLLPCAHPPSHSLPESHLHKSPISSVEFIHRGPDGRFVVEPFEEISTSAPAGHMKPRQELAQSLVRAEDAVIRKSQSIRSYRDERRHPPFVLSVDMPACGSDIFPSGRVQAMAKHLSLRGCCSQEEEFANRAPDQSSLFSESSGSVLCPQLDNMSLKRGSTRSTASTLVLQMEHEREQGNLNRCLKLAQEREELERELRKYCLSQDTVVHYSKKGGSLRVKQKKAPEVMEGTLWKGRGMGSLHSKQLSSRGHCLSNDTNSLGIRASSCIPWEATPMMSTSDLVQSGHGRAGECLEDSHLISVHRRSRSLERGEHQKSHTNDRRRRRTMIEGAPVCVEGELFYPTLERAHYTAEGSLKIPGTYSHNEHRIVPSVSNSLDKQQERIRGQAGHAGDYVEMSVDEPEEQTPLTRSMIDCICDTLDYQRPSLYQLERESQMENDSGYKTIRRGLRRDLGKLSDQSSRTLPSQRQTLHKSLSVGSQHENHHKSTPSLDSKLYKEQFLTPDAWIDSLSSSPFTCRPSSELQKHHFIPNKKTDSQVPSKIEQQDSHPQPASNSLGVSTLDPHQHLDSMHHSPTTLPLEGSSWSHCHSSLDQMSQRHDEQEEEDGPEVDVEIRGYRDMPEPEGSCRSYASQSSGRGSLDHPSSRQSLSLSPPLMSSPETTEESDRDDTASHKQTLKECPRRASVDENYEWDSHYVSMHPADPKASVSTDGLERKIRSEERQRSHAVDDSRPGFKDEKKGLFPSVSLAGSVPVSVVPSCEETALAQDILHGSTCYPDPEPDAVLF